jgi:hypothetical protein
MVMKMMSDAELQYCEQELFDYVVGMDRVVVRDDGMMVMMTTFTKYAKTISVVHGVVNAELERKDELLVDYGPGLGKACPMMFTVGVW